MFPRQTEKVLSHGNSENPLSMRCVRQYSMQLEMLSESAVIPPGQSTTRQHEPRTESSILRQPCGVVQVNVLLCGDCRIF